MVSKKVHKRLWDYGLVHKDGILSRIDRGKTERMSIEELTDQTPDIPEWLDFELYDCVWWIIKNHPSTTVDNIILG